MSDYSEYGDGNYDEVGAVVGGASVPVAIELGRFESSNRELMGFHVGQVIDLRRSPYEPVDLVVDGRVFAKGELVEIDGQMGIRIVKLFE